VDLQAHGGSEGPGAERREAPPASGLPCLFETTASVEASRELLPGPWKKQAEAIKMNVIHLGKLVGLESLGFHTLTCGDFVANGQFRGTIDRDEFQRRWHSLLTNVLQPRYRYGIAVVERSEKRGYLHPHIVHSVSEDIRTGLDFDACFPPKGPDGKPVRKPDYMSASQYLRDEWAFWRETAPKYGFGRCQLQPIRKTLEAAACYQAKYLTKHFRTRWPEDIGRRNLRYFGVSSSGASWRRWYVPFGWAHVGGYTWREMLRQLGLAISGLTIYNAVEVLGKRWAHRAAILFDACEFDSEAPGRVEVRQVLCEHNAEVAMRRRANGGVFRWHVSKLRVDHFWPCEKWLSAEEKGIRRLNLAWQDHLADLELARSLEAEDRKWHRGRYAPGVACADFDDVLADWDVCR